MGWSDSVQNRQSAGESFRDSIRHVVRRFEAPLMRYALRLLNDPEEAQETFLRLCAQNPATHEGRSAVWLFSVCRNLCVEMKRTKVRAACAGRELAVMGAPAIPAPDQLAERDENLSDALDLFDKLSAHQQEVIRLKFQHGLSYREIADVTQLTVTNVGFLIHTGLKNTREQLA